MQAALMETPYLACMQSAQGVQPWLLAAAREARGSQEQLDVAYHARVSISAVSRFEKGESWPQPERLETLIGAYAQLAGVRSIDIWEDALRRWRAGLEQPTESYELDRDELARAHAAIPKPAAEQSRTPPSRRRASGQGGRP